MKGDKKGGDKGGRPQGGLVGLLKRKETWGKIQKDQGGAAVKRGFFSPKGPLQGGRKASAVVGKIRKRGSDRNISIYQQGGPGTGTPQERGANGGHGTAGTELGKEAKRCHPVKTRLPTSTEAKAAWPGTVSGARDNEKKESTALTTGGHPV